MLMLWLVVAGVQLIYILFFYTKTAFYKQVDTSSAEAPTGVTVVVCAWNEHDNLVELLPLLDQQTYPEFEVLVMDDRSSDGSQALLEEMETLLPHLRVIRISQTPDHITAKKYAVTIALKKATYPTVLLTDADCRPVSDTWIAEMVAPLANPATSLVLGFSPYEQRPGFLNFLIQSETLFTAVQYFSLALGGKPYMGVGRNLLYRRQLFFDNKGFYSHMNVIGGDDDLFVNEVATAHNTAVNLNPTTFTWSKPKETWAEWRHQKRRHLHVGRFYKPGHKARLGLLTGSHVLTWLLGLVVGVYVVFLAITGQLVDLHEPLLLVATGAFLFRWLTFWGVVGRISYRLSHTVHWAIVPVMDVILAIYYAVMGTVTLFTKRRHQIKWR